MLDISKKYWVTIEPLCIRCSIIGANVSFNTSGEPFGKDGVWEHSGPVLKDLPISEEAKAFFSEQCKSGYPVPTAFPDNPESIKYLQEMEDYGYFVFYDVDEPVGYSLSDDQLVEDESPLSEEEFYIGKSNLSKGNTLEKLRKERWESIDISHVNCGFESRPMPEYPVKEFLKDWF